MSVATGRVPWAARTAGLTVYVTAGDPLAGDPAHLARRLVAAGASAIELGVPTPSARPRGATVRRSFARADALDARGARDAIARVREAVPTTPVLVLALPETSADLGAAGLVRAVAAGGADALVIAAPERPDDLRRARDEGVDPVPLIGPGTPSARRAALEAEAGPLTYLPLAATTGATLERAAAARVARRVAAVAARPFLAGFGVRSASDVAALAPHAAGVVVGSACLELLEGPVDTRAAELDEAVRGWAAAARPDPGLPPADPTEEER